MNARSERAERWKEAADNRKPIENTPRRDAQIQEWERQQRRTA